MDQLSPDYQSDLPDLVDVPIRDVIAVEGPALAHIQRRLELETDRPSEILAGFQSNI
jgi:hypothetical protein